MWWKTFLNIFHFTGIAPDPKLFVASTDFGGPLPGVPKQETDYNLPLSWAVIGIWFLKYMLESRLVTLLLIYPYLRKYASKLIYFVFYIGGFLPSVFHSTED